MKTEFLVQLDGAGTKAKDVILVVGMFSKVYYVEGVWDNSRAWCHQGRQTDHRSLMKLLGAASSNAYTFRSRHMRHEWTS
jgi:hypothetical protein